MRTRFMSCVLMSVAALSALFMSTAHAGASTPAEVTPSELELKPLNSALVYPNFKTLEVANKGDHDIAKFVFDGPVDDPFFQFQQSTGYCGSGFPVVVDGAKFLLVSFGAQGFDYETGQETYAPPSIGSEMKPNLPSIKELEPACLGFEAEISYVIGLPEGKQPIWFRQGNSIVVKVPH